MAATVTALVGGGSPLISDSWLGGWVAVAMIPTVAALIVAHKRLLARQGWALMVIGATAAVVVLVAGTMLDEELRADGAVGVAIWLALAGSPAVAAGSLAASPRVRRWIASAR